VAAKLDDVPYLSIRIRIEHLHATIPIGRDKPILRWRKRKGLDENAPTAFVTQFLFPQ
jgi:hypothetical protein